MEDLGKSTSDDFLFTPIGNDIQFPNIFQKEIMKLLEKWGLQNLELFKFRFNIAFDVKHIDAFLKGFLSSTEVLSVCQGLQATIRNKENQEVSKIKAERLSTSAVNMDILDVMYDKEIVSKSSGRIKQDWEEYYEGILLPDKLKSSLVKEEDENFTVWSHDTRREFLFRIFSHIVIGGSLCQYEDYVQEYVNITKAFYKDLVTATKDEDSKQIYIRSLVYEIKELNGHPLFKDFNPQNFLYLSIDPYQRTVSLLYNKWENFW